MVLLVLVSGLFTLAAPPSEASLRAITAPDSVASAEVPGMANLVAPSELRVAEWEGRTLGTWQPAAGAASQRLVAQRSGSDLATDLGGSAPGAWQPNIDPGTTFTIAARDANGPGSTSPPSEPVNPQGPVAGGPVPIAPVRVLDSRGPVGGWQGPLVAGSPRTLTMGGTNGIPAQATAVMANVIVTGSTAADTLVVGGGSACPGPGTGFSFAAGQTVPRSMWIKLGAFGRATFCLTGAATADVMVDVVGYDIAGGGQFVAASPARVLDSGSTLGGWGGPLSAGTPRNLAVAGVGGVPAGATGVLLNVRVRTATAPGFVTGYPAGAAQPPVPNLIFGAGGGVSNLAFIPIGTSGRVTFANAIGEAQMTVDVLGWVHPGPPLVSIGVPTNVAAAVGVVSATLMWSAPSGTEGPVLGYQINMALTGSSAFVPVLVVQNGATAAVIRGLAPGVSFRFSVQTMAGIGLGIPSSPSNGVSPTTGPPGAPNSVRASPGSKSAVVTWANPESDGGSPLIGFEVTAQPGGARCTAPGGQYSCTVANLLVGVSYTFAVRAANALGLGSGSAPSNAVVPYDGSSFHPIAPERVLDSRTSAGGWNTKLAAGAPKDLSITGRTVPATTSAVVINVTVTDGSASSFLTVFPAGSPVPTASNVNFAAGETIPNLVTVKVGTNGMVSFANAAGTVHVIADLVGYYDDGAGVGAFFNALQPQRIYDSRLAQGPVVAGTTKGILVKNQPQIPLPNTATAVVINVTVTNSSAASFLTVWNGTSAKPLSSNLNFAAGQTIPNLVIVPVGAAGIVAFDTALGSTDLIVDLVGYFDPYGGSRFHALAPIRVLDDRNGTGLIGPWGPNDTRVVGIAGGPGVASNATAVVVNTTATNATAGSFLTLFPAGGAIPTASNLNFAGGQTIANLVSVKLGAGGAVAIYNSLGRVDVIGDVVGYYAAT